MKTNPKRAARSQQGNVLVTALVLCGVLATVLGSYMKLIQTRSLTKARTLAWNSAVPVLESGLEEGFTHLHEDYMAMTANGWTNSQSNGKNLYQKRRNFSDKSYCLVTISNVDTYPFSKPVIYSQGFVPAPYGKGYISRQVQVIATNPVTFSKAISAKGTITLGGQMTVDSFDSSNTNYSTGGKYDPAKHRANGGVVTNSKGNPAINVGNGHIYGIVETGPGGAIVANSGGTVGDFVWSASNSGIEPGYSKDDMNVTYMDQTAPANSTLWLPPILGLYNYNGTNYSYQLGDGGKKVTGPFVISSGQSVLVSGTAVLYVTGDVSMTGNSFIYIAPGGSLQLYVGGATSTLSGGGIVNGTGLAANFSYIGLAANSTVSYSGNSGFVGTINAPQAAFTLSGGSSFTGSVIVNTFTASSSGAAFHFDEGLAKLGILKLLSYREL